MILYCIHCEDTNHDYTFLSKAKCVEFVNTLIQHDKTFHATTTFQDNDIQEVLRMEHIYPLDASLR